MLTDFIYTQNDSVGIVILYTLILSAFQLVFVTLAPLWISILTGIKERTKIWVVPLVPFIIAVVLGIVYNVTSDSNSLGIFDQDLAVTIIFVLYVVANLSAFVTWVIAWVICGLDKNYELSTEDAQGA